MSRLSDIILDDAKVFFGQDFENLNPAGLEVFVRRHAEALRRYYDLKEVPGDDLEGFCKTSKKLFELLADVPEGDLGVGYVYAFLITAFCCSKYDQLADKLQEKVMGS